MNGELIYAHAGFGASAVPYLDGWELQRRLHARRAAGEIPDTCLLLEHEAVYTAGKRTGPMDRPVSDPGIPVIDVDRGGKITWHGPGQLTGYPIVTLTEPVDVIAYVRAVEEAMLRASAEVGVAATRVEGRSGIWVPGAGSEPDRKLGAIGIRVSRGITMHGFALNCDNDLGWYDRIIACGIQDAGTTSLSAEADRLITVRDLIGPVERHLAEVLGATGWRRVTDPAAVAALAGGPALTAAAAG